jgi:hypothetical protein
VPGRGREVTVERQFKGKAAPPFPREGERLCRGGAEAAEPRGQRRRVHLFGALGATGAAPQPKSPLPFLRRRQRNPCPVLFVRARVLFGGRRVQPLARRATSSVALCACVRSSCFARRAATNSLDLGLSLLGVMGTTGEYVLPLARSASCNQASVSLTDASNEKRKSTAKVSPRARAGAGAGIA